MASRVVDWLAAVRVRWSAGPDPVRLVEIMARDRSAAARERALAALDRLWVQDAGRRPQIWQALWTAGVGRPSQTPDTVLRFLLSPEPPSVRMVAYLPQDTLRLYGRDPDVPAVILSLARFGDRREDVAAVLAATGEPRLLGALEAAFVEGIRHHASYSRDIATHRLWEDGGAATPLLRVVLANPHLPRPAGVALDLAALMALRHRFDLLTGFDGHQLVFRLLEMLRYEPPAPAVEALRQALRSLPPGPARDSVCWWAMALNHEATAAAVEVGYRPSEPDLVAIFLILTGQWDERTDPGGTALHDFCVGGGFVGTRAGPDPLGHLLEVLDGDDEDEDEDEDDEDGEDGEGGGGAPDGARRAVGRILRELGPGEARDQLCDQAEYRDGTARRAVVEAGFVPSDPDLVPAFLYLTRQWDRYDAADPDGGLLRTYAAALTHWDFTRDDLRAAAAEAGRPMPCDSRDTGTPARYRPGGSGLSGTGGFSVHV